MDAQTRYDAVLVAIPALVGLGALVSAVTGGARGVAAGSVAATVTIGAALFSRPPTENSDG